MTDVLVIDKDIVVEVQQPTVPAAAKPPNIGLVEINQLVQRGSIWSTGHGAPTAAGGQAGDMYLDVDTGDIYQWNGATWDFQGTFAPATLTPAEILAALITVDGAGSNLDADLLDGQHGAYYATQADMTAVEDVNTNQDADIAANASNITFNANNITDLQSDMTAVQAGQTAAAILAKLITVDGPGSGLDADTLDGHDTAFFLPAGNYTAADILAKLLTVDGAGSGLDADLLDGHDTAYFLPAGTYTAADILTKLKTVDGSGSGLDADMVDGHDTAYLLALANATGTISDTQHGNRGGGSLHALATSLTAGFMQDAPADSFVYGRKNNAWATVIGGATTDDNPPAGPLQDGQMWWKSSTGVLYLWYDDGNSQQWVQVAASPQIVDQYYERKTAQTRNRVVNGAMQCSQENGNALVNTSNAYAVDQFFTAWSGAMVLSAQRRQIVTPNGSRDRLQITVSTVDTAIAAGDYALIATRIEGGLVADFRYGSAAAMQAVLRFGFKGPAGTYHIVIGNGGGTRSYIGQMVISAGQANTDTEQDFVIPGDVTGTWAVDNTIGLQLYIVLASGSNFLGALGWQAGNILATSAQWNAVAAANVFELFDVGLYLDPENTGLPPPWQSPDVNDELTKCMRYWEYIDGEGFGFSGNATSASGYSAMTQYRVPKRTNPTLLGSNASAVGFPTTVGATAGDVNAMRENRIANATGSVGFRSNWQANARM